MSRTPDEIREDVEGLAEEFKPLREYVQKCAMNGGIPEETRDQYRQLGRELRDEIDAFVRSAGAERAREFEELRTLADDAARSALDALNASVAWDGFANPVEFLRVRKIGRQRARWVFTVQSRRAEEPFELESLTTKQARNLSNLAERADEADAGDLPTPRQGSEKWRPIWSAIKAAAEFEDHGATEEGTWRRRLALYIDGERRTLDPSGTEDKRAVLGEISAHPFEDPSGRVWVFPGHFHDFLDRRRLDTDEATVRSALKRLGFEPRQLTARIEGKPRARRYWRSPRDFDWRDEA